MAEETTEEDKDIELLKLNQNRKKRIIIFVLGGLLLLGGLGGGLFFFMGRSNDSHPKPTEDHSSDQKTDEHSQSKEAPKAGEENLHDKKKEAITSTEEKEAINFGSTFPMGTFQINLGSSLENRYLRMEISIEYKGGQTQLKEIEARKPQLRDAIISVASRKSREFLLTGEGKDQLRMELLNRVNQYMERKIEAIYLTDLLIE